MWPLLRPCAPHAYVCSPLLLALQRVQQTLECLCLPNSLEGPLCCLLFCFLLFCFLAQVHLDHVQCVPLPKPRSPLGPPSHARRSRSRGSRARTVCDSRWPARPRACASPPSLPPSPPPPCPPSSAGLRRTPARLLPLLQPCASGMRCVWAPMLGMGCVQASASCMRCAGRGTPMRHALIMSAPCMDDCCCGRSKLKHYLWLSGLCMGYCCCEQSRSSIIMMQRDTPGFWSITAEHTMRMRQASCVGVS